MTECEWLAFRDFRERFRKKTEDWAVHTLTLYPLQAAAAQKDTPPYPVQTAVVYNRALDEVAPEDDIKLIVIGDNPGKDEQRAENNRYLVGQSGKVADGFFKRNPELGVDFRKNVIILNKTPVHTAKTAHLKYVRKNGGEKIARLIEESQVWMAEATARLHKSLPKAELWLVGYAELKARGIFTSYKNALQSAYNSDAEAWERVFVFQHFSMNRFLIDLKEFRAANQELSLADALKALGSAHKDEIFGTSEAAAPLCLSNSCFRR
ncbi:MAG: hypothetical protein ACTTKL_06090 [Treponema sp.]